MKRLFSLLMVLVFVLLSFSGCNNNGRKTYETYDVIFEIEELGFFTYQNIFEIGSGDVVLYDKSTAEECPAKYETKVVPPKEGRLERLETRITIDLSFHFEQSFEDYINGIEPQKKLVVTKRTTTYLYNPEDKIFRRE